MIANRPIFRFHLYRMIGCLIAGGCIAIMLFFIGIILFNLIMLI